MADSPQTLLEFTDSILSDLERGAITPQEAISACQQYAYLRESFSTKSSVLTEAALAGDDELLQALKNIFIDARSRLRELPSFQGTEQDAPLLEKEIRDAALLRQAAFTRTRDHTKTLLASHQEQRRTFIHNLVSKYSAVTSTVTDTQLESVVNGALITASRSATTQQTRERFAEMMAANVAPDQRARVQSSIMEALSKNDEYFSSVVSANKSEREIVSAVYEHLELKRPDVLVDVIINAPENQKGDALIRGVKLAAVAGSLEQRGGGDSVSSRGFLAPGTAKGVTKGLQQAADGILSLVGEPFREMIYHEKINGTLQSLLSGTQQLTDRLGETFVHSALFTQISQNLTKSLSEKPQTNGAGSVFSDVFSAVFRGPLEPALLQAGKDRLLDYFELARASATAPKGYAFLPPGMLPWNIFNTTTTSLSQFQPQSNTSRRSPWLAAFPFLSLGRLGDRVGNLFSSSVDKTTSFLFNNPILPREIHRSRRAALGPTSIFQDLPLLVAIVVVATIVILFIFPSPFNTPQIGYASKVGSLFASLFQTDGSALNACADISGAHIKQTDPQWSSVTCKEARPEIPACKANPTACNIGASGCGTTSATIILKAFGVNTTVVKQWDKQHTDKGYAYYPPNPSEGFSLYYCRSYHDSVLKLLRDEDLSVASISVGEIKKILEDCGLVLALVDEKWANSGPTSHFIVITGITTEGGVTKVTTLDPMREPGYVSTVTNNPTKDGDVSLTILWSVVK